MKVLVDIGALSVNEVIRRYPASVEVFKRYGIDACCGGPALVGVAAERHGADPEALVAELQLIAARSA